MVSQTKWAYCLSTLSKLNYCRRRLNKPLKTFLFFFSAVLYNEISHFFPLLTHVFMRVMFLSVMFIVHFNSVQREGVILKKKKNTHIFLLLIPEL